MIKTIEEMKDYLVRECNDNLEDILKGLSSEFVLVHQGRANMCLRALANLGYDIKVDMKLEKTEI